MDIYKEFESRLIKLKRVIGTKPEALFTNNQGEELTDAKSYLCVAKFLLKTEDSITEKKAAELFKAKNEEYGPDNIAAMGLVGLYVRISDKIARLSRIAGKEAQFESYEDNVIDLFNYCIIAAMICEGAWLGLERHTRRRANILEMALYENGGLNGKR